MKFALKIYDIVRIDHFRGFSEYYGIPYENKTAEKGKWYKGPGYALFETIREAVGNENIIAEDLGYLTESVYKLLDDTGYPGMRVLQFAYSVDVNNIYLLHNHKKNSVLYTGTHDNDTLVGYLDNIDKKRICFYQKNYGTLGIKC